MQNVINLNKPQFLTPLQCIEQFKTKFPKYKDKKLSAAGRLDPMAEGVLLILVDNENKKRNYYEALQKTYEFEVLFGIATDTYDILGKITSISKKPPIDLPINQQFAESLSGTYDQPYPPYSSFHIKGKPLFYYAREGKLDGMSIPTKKITIMNSSLLSQTTITKKDLSLDVIEKISKIKGEFRQKESVESWKKALETLPPNTSFPIFSFTVTCSSGTYIRSLSQVIGEKVKSQALTRHIRRTRVGEFQIADALNL